MATPAAPARGTTARAPRPGNSRRDRRPGGRAPARPALSAAAALLTAACGTAVSSTGGPPPHQLTVVRDSANGKTVHVGVGDRLELILPGSYWNLHGSSPEAVMAQDGPARYLPRPPSCPDIPGLGCSPTTATFTARARGTAVITASRTTCGEALRCQPPQRRFTLTVVVGQASFRADRVGR